ncbi:MAG: DNA repair protein RecO [Lentisphaerae bacterium]|nr:DNA repair protein RecO [Lentisphaerota bacterium]
MISTSVLVLRKTPYSESSVIAATLSPDHGRLDFVIRGAKKISGRKMPQVDLFRELHVEFRMKNSGLQNLYSCELLNFYDGIAAFPDNYLEACGIGTFILRNSHPMIPCPEVYLAVKNAFEALSKSRSDIPWAGLVKLVFLDEHGFLPEDLSVAGDSRKTEAVEKLIRSTVSGNPLPDFPPKTWRKIAEWIGELCKYHELE